MHYTVKPNDSLTKIARKFSVPVELLMAFNREIRDPNLIAVGQPIYVPNVADIPVDGGFTVADTSDTLVVRARSAINKGIRYKLGMGGMNPAAALPSNASKQCDCSGFVCWILGLSRKSDIPFYKKYGGWIFTDSMVADVQSSAGIFERLSTPEPGCIVVYGAGKQIGHVGLVSEVSNGQMKKVIHCSSGNDRNYNDSIQETAPTVFNRADTVWGRFTGVV